MKKSLTILPLLLCFALGSYGQHTVPHLSDRKARQLRHSKIMELLARQSAASREVRTRPTGTRQRVLAQTFTNGETMDSTRYSYTGTRGSAYNYNNFWQPGYSEDLTPAFRPEYSPASIISPMDVLADRTRSYSDGTLSHGSSAYYNVSGTIDSTSAGIFNEENKSYLTYNTNGKIAAIRLASYNEDTLSDETLRKFTYSGNEVVTDSFFIAEDGQWSFGYRYLYHYNPAGLLDTLTQITGGIDYKSIFTYDPGGRLSTCLLAVGYNGLYDVDSKDSFGYTDNAGYLTFYQSGFYANDEYYPGLRFRNYTGAHAGPDSSVMWNITEDGTGWEKSISQQYIYNEFENPITLTLESDTYGTALMRFYYEDYEDGTVSVKSPQLPATCTAYPNPFESELVLAYNGTHELQVKLQLIDVSGKLILSCDKRIRNGQNPVSFDYLRSGVYFLQLTDQAGNISSYTLLHR